MQHDRREAVRRALTIYNHTERLSPAWREEAVKELAAQGIWSLAHIVAISGVPMHEVRKITTKTDRTGGRFNPATLALIAEECDVRARDGINDLLTTSIIREGTSVGMLARILQVTPGGIRHQLERSAAGREVMR